MPELSIVVPTFNEVENISLLCSRIQVAVSDQWDYEIVFVDDNSPDGTAEEVRRVAAGDSRVGLVARAGKLGLASAVVEGFRRCDGRYWVMMDADLSHRPEDLPSLIAALERCDVAIGSRYVDGGKVLNWPVWRQIASRFASWLGGVITGVKLKDVTSGFAVFRREIVEPRLDMIDPKGFKLVLEIVATTPGVVVKEVPITFVDREFGTSKFGIREVFTYLRLCVRLRGLSKPSATPT